mmetsp:Transcript_2032/g.7872  ORF Transcript_2032/g.7872 Transcript_2032/m.7872 type:complete len:295 (-) Transcript_2032:16-900(-)
MSWRDGRTSLSFALIEEFRFARLPRQPRSILAVWRLPRRSSLNSPHSLSRATKHSLIFSIWPPNATRASTSRFLSCSKASWQLSLTSSWMGLASRNSSRRSATFKGAHLHRCARCSWKRHSPTWRMVSSTLSMRSSKPLHKSCVFKSFFLMELDTTLAAELNLWACSAAEWFSIMLLTAIFCKLLAFSSFSFVDIAHLSSFSAHSTLLAERAEVCDITEATGPCRLSPPPCTSSAPLMEKGMVVPNSSKSAMVASSARSSSWAWGSNPSSSSSSPGVVDGPIAPAHAREAGGRG